MNKHASTTALTKQIQSNLAQLKLTCNLQLKPTCNSNPSTPTPTANTNPSSWFPLTYRSIKSTKNLSKLEHRHQHTCTSEFWDDLTLNENKNKKRKLAIGGSTTERTNTMATRWLHILSILVWLPLPLFMSLFCVHCYFAHALVSCQSCGLECELSFAVAVVGIIFCQVCHLFLWIWR